MEQLKPIVGDTDKLLFKPTKDEIAVLDHEKISMRCDAERFDSENPTKNLGLKMQGKGNYILTANQTSHNLFRQ